MSIYMDCDDPPSPLDQLTAEIVHLFSGKLLEPDYEPVPLYEPSSDNKVDDPAPPDSPTSTLFTSQKVINGLDELKEILKELEKVHGIPTISSDMDSNDSKEEVDDRVYEPACYSDFPTISISIAQLAVNTLPRDRVEQIEVMTQELERAWKHLCGEVRARLIKQTRCPACTHEFGRRKHRTNWREDWQLWIKVEYYLRVDYVFGIDNFDRKPDTLDSFDRGGRFDLMKDPKAWLGKIEKMCQKVEEEYWRRVTSREPADCTPAGEALGRVGECCPVNPYSELW